MRPELLDLILSLLPMPVDEQDLFAPGTHHPHSNHPHTSQSASELSRFYAMLRDYPERGGKGVRSELLLACAQAYGLQTTQPEWARALWAAAALELFQNWVLIHDDIEDDSDERRGAPALHRLYGTALAINAGDALHAYMWAAVAQANFAGAMPEFLNMIHRTAEGQHLDLAWIEQRRWNLSEADYLNMVQLKTAYYTVVIPLRLGALAANSQPNPIFTTAGLRLGAAFQIRDDVLNLNGDPVKYGKEIAGDLLEGKRTLVTLHWLAHAPSDQREVFLEQMQLERPSKSPQTIAKIHGWLLNSDSIQYAQEFAQTQATEGLHLLNEALTDTQPQARAELLEVVRALATRDK